MNASAKANLLFRGASKSKVLLIVNPDAVFDRRFYAAPSNSLPHPVASRRRHARGEGEALRPYLSVPPSDLLAASADDGEADRLPYSGGVE